MDDVHRSIMARGCPENVRFTYRPQDIAYVRRLVRAYCGILGIKAAVRKRSHQTYPYIIRPEYVVTVPFEAVKTPLRFRLFTSLIKNQSTNPVQGLGAALLVNYVNTCFTPNVVSGVNVPEARWAVLWPSDLDEMRITRAWDLDTLIRVLAYKADDVDAWTPKEWLTHAESIPYLSHFNNPTYLSQF